VLTPGFCREIIRFFSVAGYFSSVAGYLYEIKVIVALPVGGASISAQLSTHKRSYRIERDFGLLVGGVFMAISGWWLYRGRFPALALALLILGATLVLLGAIYPKALVVPNRLWMGMAEGMGFVMTRVILGVVFFLLVTPIGLIRRLSGGDPLGRRGGRTESYWKPYSARRTDPKHYEKMY
jgi:hypothetical protein